MEDQSESHGQACKKIKPSTRPMTTALFLLRCVQLGIPISDLEHLTIGMVDDMYAEEQNDSVKWPKMATQDDFDRF